VHHEKNRPQITVQMIYYDKEMVYFLSVIGMSRTFLTMGIFIRRFIYVRIAFF